MQSEKMQIQLCPQLTAIQEQLKSVIANHQVVFRRYQNDPENVELRDKLEEMVLQIKNLSNHQTALVKQLRENVAQNASSSATSTLSASAPVAVSAGSVSATAAVAAAATPIIVTPTSISAVGKPMGTLSPRPQLVAIQPHSIVVPLAHVQGQAALMSLPGFLAQPGGTLVAPAAQSLVNLQLGNSTATAILTAPTPLSATPVGSTAGKGNQSAGPPVKVTQGQPTILQPIQPRRSSPPIKVPQYTINHHSNAQGEPGNTGKTNGVIQRSYSDSDAKEVKRVVNQTARDVRRLVENRNLPPEEKKKLEFMGCLGLVTQDSLKELQNRRVERKRRSTANPNYSYTLDLDKKRHANSYSNGYLMGGLPDTKRPRGRPPRPSPSPGNSRPSTPDSGGLCEDKREVCAECGKGGQLLLCGTCSFVYHLDCLSPPLATAPPSPWSCPACIVNGKGTGALSNGALSMVNSYISHRANKQDERQKLQKKNAELFAEKQALEERQKALTQQIEDKRERCDHLTASTAQKTAAVDTLKSFIKSFQDAPPPPPPPPPTQSFPTLTPTPTPAPAPTLTAIPSQASSS